MIQKLGLALMLCALVLVGCDDDKDKDKKQPIVTIGEAQKALQGKTFYYTDEELSDSNGYYTIEYLSDVFIETEYDEDDVELDADMTGLSYHDDNVTILFDGGYADCHVMQNEQNITIDCPEAELLQVFWFTIEDAKLN